MLKVYNLQKMKVKSTKLYESLKYLSVLKQMLPILENLIEQAGNFETALDLIQNASNMLDTKLQNVKLSKVFKKKLEHYKFRCSQRL
jgi:hypothetical protein